MSYDVDALEAATRSTKYPGKPFGFEYNADMAEIEDQMIKDGLSRDNVSFTLEASRRYSESKRGDLKFSQRQDLAKWLGLRWAGGSRTNTRLTRKELEYIATRIFGANDPTGQSAAAKVSAMLDNL